MQVKALTSQTHAMIALKALAVHVWWAILKLRRSWHCSIGLVFSPLMCCWCRITVAKHHRQAHSLQVQSLGGQLFRRVIETDMAIQPSRWFNVMKVWAWRGCQRQIAVPRIGKVRAPMNCCVSATQTNDIGTISKSDDAIGRSNRAQVCILLLKAQE